MSEASTADYVCDKCNNRLETRIGTGLVAVKPCQTCLLEDYRSGVIIGREDVENAFRSFIHSEYDQTIYYSREELDAAYAKREAEIIQRKLERKRNESQI